MITLTRRQVRTLRGVFRRSILGIAHRGVLPPLQFTSRGDQVCARYRYGDLAVEQLIPATGPATGTVLLPLDALADLEGRDESPLTLEAVAPDRTVARWSDRGIPQVRDYPVPTTPAPAPFPEPPDAWSAAPGDLLDALAAATATTTADSTRYALDCLLLRSGPAGHEVVATDGHQALIRGGFAFPWAGDVLVRGTPLFAARDLPRDRPWAIGRTATHVALRCDPYLILLEVRTDARFPRVDSIFPDPTATLARLRIDPADAAFLAGSLGRLPGADAPHSPVTVDLNGHIAIRARDATGPTPTELVLSRSSYGGTPVRFGSNRDFLARALHLGFTEVEVGEPGSPLVCRSGPAAYAWQPLDPDSAIAPSPDVIRIESPAHPPVSTPRTPEPTSQPMTTADRREPTRTVPAAATPTATNPDPAASSLLALIREAESLHEALGAARTRSQGLIVALKRQRKQARLMAATLHSLRQLGLQEVAG